MESKHLNIFNEEGRESGLQTMTKELQLEPEKRKIEHRCPSQGHGPQW